jgi:hypothetical protein
VAECRSNPVRVVVCCAGEAVRELPCVELFDERRPLCSNGAAWLWWFASWYPVRRWDCAEVTQERLCVDSPRPVWCVGFVTNCQKGFGFGSVTTSRWR